MYTLCLCLVFDRCPLKERLKVSRSQLKSRVAQRGGSANGEWERKEIQSEDVDMSRLQEGDGCQFPKRAFTRVQGLGHGRQRAGPRGLCARLLLWSNVPEVRHAEGSSPQHRASRPVDSSPPPTLPISPPFLSTTTTQNGLYGSYPTILKNILFS